MDALTTATQDLHGVLQGMAKTTDVTALMEQLKGVAEQLAQTSPADTDLTDATASLQSWHNVLQLTKYDAGLISTINAEVRELTERLSH